MTRVRITTVPSATMNKYQANVPQLRPRAMNANIVKHDVVSNKRSYTEAFFQSNEDEDEDDDDEDNDDDDDEDDEDDEQALRIARSEEALKQFDIIDILNEYQGKPQLSDYFEEVCIKLDNIEEMRNDCKKLKNEAKRNDHEIRRLKHEVEKFKRLWIEEIDERFEIEFPSPSKMK